jgi:arginyl-tRNA synthetase
MRGGEEVKISKRACEYVTLRELTDWVGRDAVRFFLISRRADSEFVFDVDLALSQSEENPVYYVQYAHARCSSILRNAVGVGVTADASGAAALLHHPAEQTLIRHLLDLPDVVAEAADRRETHELTRYLLETAQLFSQFYRDCRVLSEEPAERPLSQARVALTDATRTVLANGLGLLGISAPESM